MGSDDIRVERQVTLVLECWVILDRELVEFGAWGRCYSRPKSSIFF
jgi:hypothetical protein